MFILLLFVENACLDRERS